MTTILAENENIDVLDNPEVRAMIDAGIHIGHTKNKRHPAMAQYIWTVRGGISIIDVTKTKTKLEEACVLLKQIAAKGGVILFVGTRPAARKLVLEAAQGLRMPYVVDRWIGGTLTNFKVITKRVETMISLEQKQASGELGKYTKKEKMRFEEEIERLKGNFDGLRTLTRTPDALFVVNVPHDEIAVREAVRMKIPVIALCDTNANPGIVTHPIPSNDDALPAIRFMLAEVARAIEAGRQEAASISSSAPVVSEQTMP